MRNAMAGAPVREAVVWRLKVVCGGVRSVSGGKRRWRLFLKRCSRREKGK